MPMQRRESLQWMLAAATLPAWSPSGAAVPKPGPTGYGTDPDLVKTYRAGELWPLTFSERQRRCAEALCAVIIPADEHSPSAAELQVHQFIDEWVSAPYPDHVKDKALIVQGLAWMDAEAGRRFRKPFAEASLAQQQAICDDICIMAARSSPRLAKPAGFFARFRDLTAGGFYTSPQGMRDLGFVGNTPSETFDGPPPEVLKIVGIRPA
ncbi:MAG TPA: gluconate 2-dehydrogenase subunit 3 family protein [Ideonella sp.]|uniref:gluconate 2-dehydrogenase subunit 3 family protein n=1 Tax=Ideonella sp. TaxID=1929293 RepID=UPI002C5F3C3C|nr:gluconate 2-dehydrogenase subunit 3 family protein [Ideonella sp.]HSI52145.1 gluconate 2-dehydrogenase subunit 3 family protein [Ideonella sp.]